MSVEIQNLYSMPDSLIKVKNEHKLIQRRNENQIKSAIKLFFEL